MSMRGQEDDDKARKRNNYFSFLWVYIHNTATILVKAKKQITLAEILFLYNSST